MTKKTWMYSVLEAVQHEMREDPKCSGSSS